MIISRTASSCQELIDGIVEAGGQAGSIVADLTDASAAQEAVSAAIGHLGRVDGLFNVAGAPGGRWATDRCTR